MEELLKLLEIAKEASIDASVEVLKIYESGDFSVEAKADDSPLTLADKASHHAIVSKLEASDIPILSEEGADIDYSQRKDWGYFWMIDPLDGTKEFIKQNGEFTINIALVKNGKPILGVVQVPVLKKLYYAVLDQGAFMDFEGSTTKLVANSFRMTNSNLKVVASRSHLNDQTSNFIKQLKDPEIVSMGSSLKLLAVAEGKAHLYPRFAPTMEWDTAAAHIIVEEAGGKVLQNNEFIPLEYNKSNLLNPHFLVTGQDLGTLE